MDVVSGDVIRSFGSSGREIGQLSNANGIRLSRDGRYVAVAFRRVVHLLEIARYLLCYLIFCNCVNLCPSYELLYRSTLMCLNVSSPSCVIDVCLPHRKRLGKC